MKSSVTGSSKSLMLGATHKLDDEKLNYIRGNFLKERTKCLLLLQVAVLLFNSVL